MPYLSRPGADLYYDVRGSGDTLVALHGLAENADYWHLSGVADLLAWEYRFISVDMRGHGRSRVTSTGSPGFDVDTLADDLGALVDELDLAAFHLLGHATGGMVAVRYATSHPSRLTGLILVGTSSATGVVSRDKVEKMAAGFRGKSWDVLLPEFRADPGPFLFHLDRAADAEELWTKAAAMFRRGDPDTLAAFIASFYDDADPRSDSLRSIACPTLVLAGEHDVLMRPSSEQLADSVPGAQLIVLPGVGHMTAFEAPTLFVDEIVAFCRSTRSQATVTPL